MRAGSLSNRVTLQRPGGSRDAHGERTTTWTDVAVVYARIRSLSVREAEMAGQRQVATSHAIEIRYSSVVAAMDASWRVKFGTRTFAIDGILNAEERNVMLTIYCTEGLRDE